MNDNINFVLAKLLKEAKFTLPCYSFFTEEGELMTGPYFLNHNSSSDVKYSAPTIADVIMWLHEKYNLWLYAHPFGKEKYHFTVIKDIKGKRENLTMYDETLYGGVGKGEGIVFDSINEAYEAAIFYTLTKLLNNERT